MKRILSLALALVMVLLVMNVPVAGAEPEGLSEFAGLEPIDVTISFWQYVDPNGEYEGEKFAQKVREEFGINLVSVPVT